MNHIEGNFKGVRGAQIYYQAWLPAGEVKAVLIVTHGLGDHSGRYMNLVNYFVPLGYAIYSFDHLGHGKSEGAREVIERFEDFTSTLKIYYDMVMGWQPDKAIFLVGHSTGGLIACCYLLDYKEDFKGAVISAPAIKAGASISPLVIRVSKILSEIVPRMGMQALDTRAISRDPQVVAAYANDPLVFHGKTPARMAGELLKAIARVTAEVRSISHPFIVVQGSQDRLVEPSGTQMLYEQAGSKDKTIKIYEGLYHEVFNEPERDKVLSDMEAWLAAHV